MNDHSISNVLYIASLSFNLLSVGQLCDLDFQCLFTEKEVVVSKKDDDHVIFKGFRYNNLYLVDFTSEDANLKTCVTPNFKDKIECTNSCVSRDQSHTQADKLHKVSSRCLLHQDQ